MLVLDLLIRRLFHLYTISFVFVELESVPHRAGLDIQLYHANWEVAEDDNMEGMRLSSPLSSYSS
jgi:hypothetical protein